MGKGSGLRGKGGGHPVQPFRYPLPSPVPYKEIRGQGGVKPRTLGYQSNLDYGWAEPSHTLGSPGIGAAPGGAATVGRGPCNTCELKPRGKKASGGKL